MNLRALVFGILVLVVRSGIAHAETIDPALANERPHRWSIETETVQPFIPNVGIARLRVTRNLWGAGRDIHGDLVVGAYIRPHVEHDILYTIDEYMVTAGYRQYFWRGLHAEVLLNAGAAWGTNRFDQKDYTTASLFVDANVGYRLGFFEPGGLAGTPRSWGFFVTPQVGVLGSLGVADIGPRNGKSDWFPQAALLAGLSF